MFKNYTNNGFPGIQTPVRQRITKFGMIVFADETKHHDHDEL